MSDHPHDPNEPPEDPLPALLAEIDQSLMLSPQLARLAWSYFIAFKTEGFTDQQAVYLTACQLQSDPGTAP